MARLGLDAERVVDEAATIADAEGLLNLTLSRVARALGVRTPSLYSHVEGLPGLRRRLTRRSCGELRDTVRDAAVGRSGVDALKAMGWAYRAYARDHPGCYASTLLPAGTDDSESTAAEGCAEDVLAAVLERTGINGEEVPDAVRVARAVLHGFVMIELDGGFGLSRELDKSFECALNMVWLRDLATSERGV